MAMDRRQPISAPSSSKNDWLARPSLLPSWPLPPETKSGQNKKDFKEMTRSLLETVQVLQEAVDSGRGDTSMFKEFCFDFEQILGSLAQEIQAQANSRGQRGILGIFKANKVRDKVDEYRRRIELLKSNFSLHVSVGTRIAQETTLDAISNLDNGFQAMHSGLFERLANIDTTTRDVQRSIHNQSMLSGAGLGVERSRRSRVYARKIYVLMEADLFLQRILSTSSPAFGYNHYKTCEIVSCLSELETSSKPKLVRVYRSGLRAGQSMALQRWKEDREMFLRARHPNVLQLYGCCDSEYLSALVFHADEHIGLACELLNSARGYDRFSLINSWEDQFSHACEFLRPFGLTANLDSTEVLCTGDKRLQLCQLENFNPDDGTFCMSIIGDSVDQHIFYGNGWEHNGSLWDSSYSTTPLNRSIYEINMPLNLDSLHHFYRSLTGAPGYVADRRMMARTWHPSLKRSGFTMYDYANLPPGSMVDDSGDLLSFPDPLPLENAIFSLEGAEEYVELPGNIFRIPISESGIQVFISKRLTPEMEDQIRLSAFTQVDQWFNRTSHWTFHILCDAAFQINITIPRVLEASFMQQTGSENEDSLDEPLFVFVSLEESLLHGMTVYQPTCYISRDLSGSDGHVPPSTLGIDVRWRKNGGHSFTRELNGYQLEAFIDLHDRILKSENQKFSISEYMQLPRPLLHIVTPRITDPTFTCKACESQGIHGHSHPRELYGNYRSDTYVQPPHPEWHSL
ncbi:hypothetical protein C8J56DRAFT_1035349 [Mycena floridula]|nr:hypothetical protein C8J56DRAFT_1035349 [Mycena floridula]